MQVLVLASQKGGSGKSTTAIGLAVAAMQAGETVVCLDADPQGSLAAWGRRRQADGIDDIVVRAVQPREVDGLLDRVRTHGKTTLVVIDTPGRLDATVTPLLQGADLVLVPVKPSILDVEASSATIKALGLLERKFVFVLAQVSATTPARTEEARAVLAPAGMVAPPAITTRTAHLDAMVSGKGVTEIGGKAGDEIGQLWAWVKSAMGRKGQAR